MRHIKSALAIILALLMIFAAMPITAMAETETGRLGTSNVYYELTDEGVLRLYGTGATPNYPAEAESSPFAGKYVEKVVVEQGITSIGNYIFAECWDVEEVSLPKSLRYVGNVAFGGCSKLKEITFNSYTENFGFAALYNCRSLKSVTFKSNKISCFGLYSGESNSLLGHVEDATIYVNLPMMIEETQDGVTSTASSYEDAVAKFGQNNNTVYCVNDNAKIKWKNYDGTVLETDENATQGEIPTYNGATPTKPSDDANAYYFTGWTPQPFAVMGDMSYTATFGSYAKSAYLDQNGEEQEVFARPLTGTETLLSPGWYVVNKNINYSHTLYFTDSVHIILADGKKLTFSNGCDFSLADPSKVDVDSTYEPTKTQLNFYWQSGKSGALTMNGQILTWRLNVYGGNITSKVSGYVSTFYDGNLTFKDEAQCMSLNVYGGNVKMESCDASVQFNVYGGNFQCTGTVTTNAPAYVTLGYTKPSDSIYIGYLYLEGNKNNYVNQHVKIKDGQKMADAANRSTVFEGVLPLSSDLITVPDINGKTLVPYAHNTITYAPSIDGAVTGVSEADFGDEITLTVTPDEGYAFDELTVKTADNKNIEVVDNKFIMPATAVTVSATFISTKRYTVKWIVNGEQVETDENLTYGMTPEFGGEAPANYFKDGKHYAFCGWNDGANTYTYDELPNVTADVCYTAAYAQTEHNYGEPVWNWSEDYTSATAEFTCNEQLCNHKESVSASVETEATDAKIIYTATVQFNGKTYKDTVEVDNPCKDSYNLTLEDGVKVNFYIDMPYYNAVGGHIEYSYLVSTDDKNAERKTYVANDDSEEFKAQENGTRKLTLKAAPAQIAEKYIIKIYDSNEELKDTVTASIQDYCNVLINSDFAQKDKDVAQALLNYGALADEYFGYAEISKAATGEEYSVAHSEDYKDAVDAESFKSKAKASVVPGVDQSGAALNITGISYVALLDPELRFYVNQTNDVWCYYTDLSISDPSLTAEWIKTDKGNCVRVTGLKASDFAKTFTLTIGTTEVTYNGYAYLYTVLREGSTVDNNLKNLAKGIYRYAAACEAKFA